MTSKTALRGVLAVAAVHARNVALRVPAAGPVAAARASDGLADIDKRIGLSSQLGDERLLRPRASPPIPAARPRS